MTLLLVSVLGLALFLWPFTGLGLPTATPALAIGLGAVLGLLAVEVGGRRLDARGLALLAALSAIDAGLRAALVTGIGGFSPVFILVLCGGFALGPEFGFLLGGCSLLVSALVTGGIGPWVPYQLFAVGWVGAAAGLAGLLWRRPRPGRREVLTLALVGALTGFAYGALMDVWDWTFYVSSPGIGWSPHLPPLLALSHFARFYLLTSLGYDSFRAGGNLLAILVLGLPLLLGLRRLRRRLGPVLWLPRAPSLLERADASADLADHQAAGHLVVPALLAAVDRDPEESQPKGDDVDHIADDPHQAPAQA